MEKLQIEIKNGKIKAPLKGENVWLIYTPEEEVRQKTVCRLVNDYGYSLNQMAQEISLTDSKRGTGRASADIVVWKTETDRLANPQKSPVIIVECKAEKVTLHAEDYFQGRNYAAFADAVFFVATNEKETKFFKVIKGIIPKDVEEIIDIPHARDLSNEKKINELLAQTKIFSREEFQRLLFTCHDVIRNNDKLSPEMAFDEISKILFMKIRYERRLNNAVFSAERFKQLKEGDRDVRGAQADRVPFYQYLFEQTKEEFVHDEIFEPTDVLRIRETSFLQIVRLLEKYNLSDTSDDVKGIAFEEFLGKTFRGDLGQFFTPRTIVDFMVSMLDPQEGEIICDPCCGTGGFLIKSFEHIREKIERDIQLAKDRFSRKFITEDYDRLPEKEKVIRMENLNQIFAELNLELEPNISTADETKTGRVNDLSMNRIYGTDAEPRSARTAKMNMIMHGDGHGGVHHHDGLLPVNGIFEERFDVILTNPPFGARVSRELEITANDLPHDQQKIRAYAERYGEAYEKALEKVREKIGKPLISLFDTGDFSTLTEVVFVERCLCLLRKGGRMGVVLPEGFLNNVDLQRVRDYFESKAKLLLVVSIPQDVFIAAGATVKPSLVFLKRFTDEEENFYNETKATVTAEINRKYQPETDKVNEQYTVLLVAYTNLNKQLRDLRLEMKKKNADQERLRAAMENLNAELTGAKLAEQNGRKEMRRKLAEFDARKQAEIRAELKKRFDYEIPIVQVEKAGITSTGARGANELPEVRAEFEKYRKQNKIWTAHSFNYEYDLDESNNLQRQREKTVNF